MTEFSDPQDPHDMPGSLNDQLMSAAFRGSAAECRRLIALGAMPNYTKEGRTPLIRAMSTGNLEVIDLLIDAGAFIDGPVPLDYSALQWAAVMDQTLLARHFLDRGADVHVANERGDTAIHLAIAHGSEKIVLMLLQAGSDLDRANHAGVTPRVLVESPQLKDLLQVWDARQAAMSTVHEIRDPSPSLAFSASP